MSKFLKSSCLVSLVSFCLLILSSAQAQSRDPYAAERAKMVEEYISSEGVENPRVLDVMGTVPRHLFVRPNFKNLAYTDQALDIGFKQTISPPFIVAYMTEMLEPQPTDKVLEIGTGSGYQAAVLSGLVEDVYSIEIVEPLGRRTQKLLQRLKYKNIHTKIGDGYQGWEEHAPFDKIIVTCSPESVPVPLIQQLKEGGKMIVPLGERYQQVFYLFEKKDGKLKQTKLVPTLFVPMTGKMEELRKVKPDPLNPKIINGGFEDDENDDGLADNWHYVRRGALSDDSSAGKKSIRFENTEAGRMSHMLQGMAIDGSKISEARVSWAMKSENIRGGRVSHQQPGISFYFYDSRRIPIGRSAIGPWLVDQEEWRRSSMVIKIPRGAKEAVVQAGLNGSTGILYLDEIEITPVR